jgi:hypothetical protein
MEISGDNLKLLKVFNLETAPISLQNHFLLLNYVVQKQHIDIVNWNKVNYEIRYGFKRENETAAFKFWINGKNEFKANYQRLPSETNSDSLFEEISKLIETAPKIIFLRNTVDSILAKIEFEIELEEEKPFLKTLFDSLQRDLSVLNISIKEIEHQSYRERYTFVRGDEIAVIDFEYNGEGFFGRVLPIENRYNSTQLLRIIQQTISKLNVYVV